jgi:hypothetical protein
MKGFIFLTASDTDGGGDDSGGDEDGSRDEDSGRSGGRGRCSSGGNKGGGCGGVKFKCKDDDKSHYGRGAMSDPGSDWRSGNYIMSDACA